MTTNNKGKTFDAVDTQAVIRQEYLRCAQDPVYFMRKYVKIQHPTRGTIPFETYDFQNNTVKELATHKLNIILKSRQMGISTLVAAYSLWLMVFYNNKEILCLSITKDTSIEIIGKVRFGNEHLPSWLRRTVTEDNKTSMRFNTKSRIRAVSSASDSARGAALSLLIIDEAAFIANAEQIWLSAQNTISTGGNAIILSTPNGNGNFFHKMWSDSQQGQNEFNRILLPWYLHPDRDAAWRAEQTKLLGERGAAQECDCQFSTSGNSVISLELIEWYEKNGGREPVAKRWQDALYVFIEPVPGKKYLISADVARGDGKDYSACHVIDIESLEQVAEYKSKISPKEYGRLLVALAVEYNSAVLIVENANVGHTTIQSIIDCAYPNLYYSTVDIQYIDDDVVADVSIFSPDKKRVAGFTTSQRTRPLVISKLEEYINGKHVKIHSLRLLDELKVFIWKDRSTGSARAEAAKGYNDDLVMSFAIGLWIRDTALKIMSGSDDMYKTLMHNIGVTRNPYEMGADSVFNTSFASKVAAAGKNKERALEQRRMQIGRGGESIDISWLF